jgi:Pentapeptide repeats (8 copies)
MCERDIFFIARWLRRQFVRHREVIPTALVSGIVKRVTLRQIIWPSKNIWSAQVEYEDGTTSTVGDTSLQRLLGRLTPFEDRHDSDSIHVKVEADAYCHRDDLLALIQVNQGGKGIDISSCEFSHIDLTRETVRELRSKFFEVNRYDPAWYIPQLGLNLRSVVANEAVFPHAQLDGADYSHAKLNGAYFDHASLIGVNFERAELKGTGLDGADLTGARLVLAHANGANFAGLSGPAKMDGASIYRADLEGA